MKNKKNLGYSDRVLLRGGGAGANFQAVRTGQQHGQPTHAKNKEKRKPGKLRQEGNRETAMCQE